MTFVRGSNPIWFEVDLTAHAFDDTFYLFILNNQIPYNPATVWHDPFGNVQWTSPIQFFANGTLPIDIFYDPGVVYRLEFRQGPSQADPLIYLVENYQPGGTGSTPIDETSFSTDNQITNPQFALVNFISPTSPNTITYTGITTQVIKVAPGWFLNLTGTGNVTLTQVPLNSSITNPSNAPYALHIQTSGTWSDVFLSQRFHQTGVLWAGTFVSSSITALTATAPQTISANLVDDLGNTIAEVLPATPLTVAFNAYPFVVQLPASIDTTFPPAAYIEYQLDLPDTCDVTVTSFQLISGDVDVEFPYEQTTVERQIDQTYNTAYPIVPIGTVIDFYGFGIPAHYFPCNGQSLGVNSRQIYELLFNTVTNVETVTLTSGVNTFTVANGSIYAISGPIEGTGIPASTTIASISVNTITMSANATASGPTSVRIFAVGNGDGSTTFNTPSLNGVVLAGSGVPAFGTFLPSTGIGSGGGAASVTLNANNMAPHTHPPLGPGTTFVEGIAAGGVLTAGGGGTLTVVASTGVNATAQNPVSVIQPTVLAQKMIRFE